jgi:hypothetical protein
MLAMILVVGRRRRFQFSLNTTLLWIVPFVALLAWAASGDEPFVSSRRVVTYKIGMLGMLLNGACVVALWRVGWFRWQAALVFLVLFALLFGTFAWKRHQAATRRGVNDELVWTTALVSVLAADDVCLGDGGLRCSWLGGVSDQLDSAATRVSRMREHRDIPAGCG